MNEVLVRPLITEKMTNISADFGKYGFLVNPKANTLEKLNLSLEKVESLKEKHQNLRRL
jgi:ribosomal protein L23